MEHLTAEPMAARHDPLTDLVIRRLLLSDLVAAAKFGTGRPVNDPERERKALNRIRQDVTSQGIDHDAAVAFFQDQMAASKVVQAGLFQHWTAHPEQAPTTRPDLWQIRLQLDDITTEIMQLLATATAIRQSDALVSEEALNRLDGLHRRALSVALQSVA